MIVGRYDNIRRYEDILPGLDEALKAACAAEDLPVGRYEFPGGYFMIQEGQTKPMEEGTYEVHRKYIDVQVLLKGSEEIAWSDPSGLETVIPYNEERDVSRCRETRIFIWRSRKACSGQHTRRMPIRRSHTLKHSTHTGNL